MEVTRFNTELEECAVGALVYYVEYAALLELASKLKLKVADLQKEIEAYEFEESRNCFSQFTWQEACE